MEVLCKLLLTQSIAHCRISTSFPPLLDAIQCQKHPRTGLTNNQSALCTGCNTRQQEHCALVFMGLIYSINSSIRRYILNISVIAFLLSPRLFFPFSLPACLSALIDSGQNAKLLECMGRCSAGPTCSIVFSSQLLQEQVGHN